MLPSLASLSLHGRTCQPCRGAASIGATKQDFLEKTEAGSKEDLLCAICLQNLDEESDANPTPPWARSPSFRAAVFGSGKSSEDLDKKEWSVVAVCTNGPHVMHIGCAHKWFAQQRAKETGPSCPECRKPWSGDLLQAFQQHDPASVYEEIMSEQNWWRFDVVAYYDFEYSRAERAINAAERKSLALIDARMSGGNGPTPATATGYSAMAEEARVLLLQYRVTAAELGEIEMDDRRLLQGVQPDEVYERAMDKAARRSIRAYIYAEVTFMRNDPTGVRTDPYGVKDLFRPAMQYYFNVCSALRKLGPDHFSPRFAGVERPTASFDHTAQRGYYLKYPSKLKYAHDPGAVTEQQFFDLYPDTVADPYPVENTYYVSFIEHHIREQVKAYLRMYTCATFLSEREAALVPTMHDARERMRTTAGSFVDTIGDMEQSAAAAMAFIRGIAQSGVDPEDGAASVLKSEAEFQGHFRRLAKLVGDWGAPDVEALMRNREVLGRAALSASSKPFFEMAHSLAKLMQFGLILGLCSVATACPPDSQSAVLGALRNFEVAREEGLSSDGGAPDAGRNTRRRTAR
jgi:hypothetical protein